MRERRVLVSLAAIVQVSADRTAHARIVDLSATGFRLLCDEPLRPGQLVEVQTGKDAELGTIKWVCGAEAGGVFASRARLL